MTANNMPGRPPRVRPAAARNRRPPLLSRRFPVMGSTAKVIIHPNPAGNNGLCEVFGSVFSGFHPVPRRKNPCLKPVKHGRQDRLNVHKTICGLCRRCERVDGFLSRCEQVACAVSGQAWPPFIKNNRLERSQPVVVRYEILSVNAYLNWMISP